MDAIKSLEKWQKILFGGLIATGFILGVIGYAANTDSVGGIGVIMVVVPIIITLVRHKRISTAEVTKTQGTVHQAVNDEYNSPQYQYETAQSLTNHTVVDFSSNDYDAQVWMQGLKKGQEIHVNFDYDKERYYMDWEVLLPPRIVNIVRNKRIVRMYVHNIIDQGEKRSIQIFVVYNEG